MTSVEAEIRTRHLSFTSQQRYRYTKPLRPIKKNGNNMQIVAT